MLRIAVLVSGGGTNLQAIIDKIEQGYMPECGIVCVVSSSETAFALERARKHGIPAVCIARRDYADADSFSRSLMEYLMEQKVDIIVLAGFMQILSKEFINQYANKIINVHPSLIPSFCGEGFYGLKPHQKALEYGVKVTGATVHFVDEGCDTGPVILQRAVYVKEDDTPEILQRRVMEEAEWEILPEALKLISEGRVQVQGRIVRIK